MSRIALLIPTLDRLGGAERQVILLAKGLTARGWDVTMIALSGSGGSAAQELTIAGVAFLSLKMRKGLADPRGWWILQRWILRNRPDVVHAHLPHAAWMARWSRLTAPCGAVLDTIHTAAAGSWGRQLGYRWSDWLTDAVTAVSQAAANAYLAAGAVRATHLIVVPNGIDTEHWRPDSSMRTQVRLELGLHDEFLWLAAGRLEPVKGYPTLLRAFARLPERAHLAIAGCGSQRASLISLAEQLGIETRVQFLGFENDVCRWMQGADGFALSSRWEGLPLALLEAAACGLPAVATDVPGISEAVIHGETGLLAARSVEAFAAAMMQWMETPAKVRAAMGACARQLVAERYGLPRILDRWEEIYAKSVHVRTRPAVLSRLRPI